MTTWCSLCQPMSKFRMECGSRQRRIVQQRLASASDWTRWDDALVVSMWVLIFTKWAVYHLRERGMADSELENLSRGASELATRCFDTCFWNQLSSSSRSSPVPWLSRWKN
jgi:hypothetical protein